MAEVFAPPIQHTSLPGAQVVRGIRKETSLSLVFSVEGNDSCDFSWYGGVPHAPGWRANASSFLDGHGFDAEMNQSLFFEVFEKWKWEWKFFLDLVETFSTDDLVWLATMTMLGGLVLGSFAGLIGVGIYKYLAIKTKAHYQSEKQSLTSEGEGTEEA